jgi:hypothetical protein
VRKREKSGPANGKVGPEVAADAVGCCLLMPGVGPKPWQNPMAQSPSQVATFLLLFISRDDGGLQSRLLASAGSSVFVPLSHFAFLCADRGRRLCTFSFARVALLTGARWSRAPLSSRFSEIPPRDSTSPAAPTLPPPPLHAVDNHPTAVRDMVRSANSILP